MVRRMKRDEAQNAGLVGKLRLECKSSACSTLAPPGNKQTPGTRPRVSTPSFL
jgi:hypothetical protein